MMPTERLQDLSCYYWLKSKLPSFVSVVDAFPANINQVDTPLTLPAASIDAIKLTAVPFELGGLEKFNRMWAIDIFGKTKSQRDDWTYLVTSELRNNILVYNYNLGFPPLVVPCIGSLVIENIQAKPIHVFRDLVKDLYWRSSITFSSTYQSI